MPYSEISATMKANMTLQNDQSPQSTESNVPNKLDNFITDVSRPLIVILSITSSVTHFLKDWHLFLSLVTLVPLVAWLTFRHTRWKATRQVLVIPYCVLAVNVFYDVSRWF